MAAHPLLASKLSVGGPLHRHTQGKAQGCSAPAAQCRTVLQAVLPPCAPHCANLTTATSPTDILLLFPVPSHFPSKNCSTHCSFISWLAPLVTSKEGWCLHDRAIPCQTLSGRRTEMCLWLRQSLNLTMLSSQYSLFPCPYWIFFAPKLLTMFHDWHCLMSNLLVSQFRKENNIASTLCTVSPSSFYTQIWCDFFPKHGKSAISTAASSLPPTFLPNKS